MYEMVKVTTKKFWECPVYKADQERRFVLADECRAIASRICETFNSPFEVYAKKWQFMWDACQGAAGDVSMNGTVMHFDDAAEAFAFYLNK
jgi:hypothetical protein